MENNVGKQDKDTVQVLDDSQEGASMSSSNDEVQLIPLNGKEVEDDVVDVDKLEGTVYHIRKTDKKEYEITADKVDEAQLEAYAKSAAPTKPSEQPSEPQSRTKIALTLLVAVIMGIFFGFLFQKSRVYDPVNIRKQFLMERFLMIKMFMGAMLASTAAIVFTYFFNKQQFEKISLSFHGCAKRGVFKAVAVGAFMLGSGMAIGGACPGMVTAQLGTNTPNAWVTLLGSIAGALAFGLVEPVMARYITSGYILKKYTLYDYYPKIRYWMFGLAVIVMAITVIVVAEVLVSWKEELPTGVSFSGNIMSLYAWPPQVCGVLLGLLQFPAIFIIQDTLGSSTGYTSVCSLATHAMSDSTRKSYFASFSKFRSGLLNWWQVPYLLASILGAFISATVSDSLYQDDPFQGGFKLQPAAAFMGGFLMLFGSRMAGGCTSGHGISGMTLAMVNSFVAVPAMFAGGISTAFIYKAVTETYVPQ